MPAAARGNSVDSVLSAHGSGGPPLCPSPLGTSTSACSGDVFVNYTGIVRAGDAVTSHTHVGCGSEAPGLSGYSPNVFANGKNVGRLGDPYSANVITSGSGNVFINDAGPRAVAVTAALDATGWEETSLSTAELGAVTKAIDDEAPYIATQPDVVSNEVGEYGDGYFGGGSPRFDRSTLSAEPTLQYNDINGFYTPADPDADARAIAEGNKSPVTGEEGALDTPEESQSEYPEASSALLNFLPHTDPRIDPTFKTKLEAVATTLGTTLTITSAYRDPDYNARVGGKKQSKHMLGIAVDVVMTSFSTQGRIDFIQACIDNGIQGIGIYNSFTHVDTGGKRAWGPSGSRTSLPLMSWAQPVLAANGYATS